MVFYECWMGWFGSDVVVVVVEVVVGVKIVYQINEIIEIGVVYFMFFVYDGVG